MLRLGRGVIASAEEKLKRWVLPISFDGSYEKRQTARPKLGELRLMYSTARRIGSTRLQYAGRCPRLSWYASIGTATMPTSRRYFTILKSERHCGPLTRRIRHLLPRRVAVGPVVDLLSSTDSSASYLRTAATWSLRTMTSLSLRAVSQRW